MALRAQNGALGCNVGTAKKQKEKTYAFQRQLDEKPSIVPGCPDW